MTISMISMQEIGEKFGQLASDEVILDVRSPEEFAEGHVPGSRNVPVDALLDQLLELKKFRKTYVYCHSGARAAYAAQVLGQAGIEVACVARGGMPHWFELGLPIER